MSYIEVLRKFHASTTGFRDPVLNAVLQMVNPVRIVEVGTTRNLAKMHRFSDGWATFAFVNHLLSLPDDTVDDPTLYIADPDPRALEVAGKVAHHERFCRKVYSDGIPAILSAQTNLRSSRLFRAEDVAKTDVEPFKKEILVYLDGANDEHGMKDQFEWCDINDRTSVLCDDLNEKGLGLMKYLNHHHDIERVLLPIQFEATDLNWKNTHVMMFFPSRALSMRLGFDTIKKKLVDTCARKVMFATQ